ncbi:putative sperm motility kinase W [Phodopus roborovskii]|uniref:putative sperm motility kinase W n=1 Tax=Phodopus roborovskii TaxID=109678 RepID=UPI0021E409C9|nr:putative sperm motility kinase W [Phodopus roborovskii]
MASHMEEDILEKDFKMLLSLGSGSFGEVKLACHLPTHTRVAVKVLEKSINSVADISSEVNILQSVEHRNIVRFFHMIDTLTTTYMIMEYVAGIDLESCVRAAGCLEEEEARPLFQQVVSAVYFLHQRHIVHRDIKLENILLDAAGNAKLCDFGMATKVTEGQMLEEICGSLLYWAPEILARKPYDGMAGDMWSLGVVLYVLVTGHFPYVEITPDGMHRLITTTMCPIPHHLSKSCHIILARLLMVPTWYRITIRQLVERPWLGHIPEHVPPDTKEILPRVVETMCSMGYTCKEIVSSLKHRQANNVTATINILKFKLSCGHSHLQDKSRINMVSSGLLSLPRPLRRASEPALPAVENHFHQAHVEGTGKGCRSSPMVRRHPCLELMPCPDIKVPERDSSMADITNTATRDMAVNSNSADILPVSVSSTEPSLDETATGFENMGFSIEEPSMGSDIQSDQSQVANPRSGTRPFRGWKLMRKHISNALRVLCCCCCCCCLPTPR